MSKTETETEKDDTIITVRIKTAKLAAFDLKIGTKSRAEIIRSLMDKFLEDSNGPIVDFEGMKANCLKLRKAEYTLEKLLREENIERLDAYTAMIRFAVTLGTDERLEKNINQVLGKLIEYKVSRDDRFIQKTLNTFIDYVEIVLKRRALETKISDYRRKSNHNP